MAYLCSRIPVDDTKAGRSRARAVWRWSLTANGFLLFDGVDRSGDPGGGHKLRSSSNDWRMAQREHGMLWNRRTSSFFRDILISRSRHISFTLLIAVLYTFHSIGISTSA